MHIKKTELDEDLITKIRIEIIEIIRDLYNRNYGLALSRAEEARDQINKLI